MNMLNFKSLLEVGRDAVGVNGRIFTKKFLGSTYFYPTPAYLWGPHTFPYISHPVTISEINHNHRSPQQSQQPRQLTVAYTGDRNLLSPTSDPNPNPASA